MVENDNRVRVHLHQMWNMENGKPKLIFFYYYFPNLTQG